MKHECKKCGLKSKNKTLFLKGYKKSGKVRNICYSCHKERQKVYLQNQRKRKRDFINSLKNVPCTDCDNRFPPYVMDFDHLGDKELNISNDLFSVKFERILAEIEKCEVVCSNCHRIRTHNRFQYTE
jgi:hypothetical protein